MKAIVVGARGTIGSAVTVLLKEKGVEVIAASRSTNPSVNITRLESIDQFYKQTGKVDAVVCAAGDAGFDRLAEISEENIELSLRSKLLGQINLVKKGLDYLNPGGVFVITGGILAYNPFPRTSLIAMVNGGLESFARAVSLELADNRRIVIVHPDWVAETARKLGMSSEGFPDAKTTATAYWEAIKGKENGQPIFVKGHEPRKFK